MVQTDNLHSESAEAALSLQPQKLGPQTATVHSATTTSLSSEPDTVKLLGEESPVETTRSPEDSTIVNVPTNAISIYDLYTTRKSFVLLLVAAVGCLQMPLADTVYFPSLYIIAQDFHTSNGVVALTIALFMLLVGISSLFWGPAADKYGRKKVLLAASVAYIIFNIVCLFSPNIIVLIVFRAFQGASVSAFLMGSVVVMDVYPLDRRGAALGLFNIPMFVGPILGPVVGGLLGEAFGWRSTFILLIIVSVLVMLALIFLLPETHHWYALRHIKKNKKDVVILEAPSIEATPPTFMKPWKTLAIVFKPHISPYLAVSCIEFGAFYGSLTLFSPVMALPPYNYPQIIIGLLYIPMGFGAMFASIYGGRITDWSGLRYPTVPEGRMYASLIISALTFPPGVLIYGWCLEYRVHVAAILVSMFIMGFGCMVYFPSVMAYVGGVNQAEAAAASSAMFCAVLVSAGISAEVVVFIAEAINFGPLACLFVAIFVVPTAVSFWLINRKIAKSQKDAPQKQVTASHA